MIKYPNLDAIIPLNFFSAPQSKDQKEGSTKTCSHLGFLVKDGYNRNTKGNTQRTKCIACQKRFGTDTHIADLYTYQIQIQQLIYDIFIARIHQKEIESRWQIPQSKVSRFKKMLVEHISREPKVFSRSSENRLPRGILRADETFMGKRGNSNTEINMINDDFETIAAGTARSGQLRESIKDVYNTIPEQDRERLRVLITDGEPAYEFIPLEASGRVIHLQQMHARRLLGKVQINKYEKFGPHHLHYIIKTNWKIFKQTNPLIEFEWEIKFIKTISRTGRGRPRKDQSKSKVNRLWRQKREQYYSDTFEKEGMAKVFINKETNTISKKSGAKQWMLTMLMPLLKIFKEKCMTNNGAESKHSQIKRKGASRKQKDEKYSDSLFKLCAYLAEHKKFPRVSLTGRPLFKYLIKPVEKQINQYVFHNKCSNSHQILLSTYME